MTEQAGSVGPPPSGQPPPPVYARKATGLVRDISMGSAVALNVSFIGIAYIALAGTSIPYGFPGASLFWVTAICAVMTVCPILLYGLFLTAMPRTGGDYIYVSRTLHPWLGFAANFNLAAWYTVNIGFLAFLVPTLGMSSAFATLGVTADSSTLTRWSTDVTEKGWAFAIGAVVIIIVFLAVNVRMKQALRFMKVIFIASLFCILGAIILLAIKSRSDFTASVAKFGGDYDKILRDAHRSGYAGDTGFNLRNTFFATPAIFTSLGYAIVTAYTGGEVRTARVSGARGMLYSLALAGVLAMIMFALADKTIGGNFLGSATYLSDTGSKLYPFAVPSFFFFFVSILTTSKVVLVIVGISFILATIATIPPSFFAATRSIFAWSFDRLIPTQISAVNERTGSPLIANAIVLGVALGYLALIAFGPSTFTTVLFTIIAGQLLTFMTVAVAGIVFPWRRRALYETSPIRRNVAGVPLITVVGVIALAAYVFFFYSLMTTSALGANSSAGIWALVIIAVVSLSLYPISYLANRRRGVDLALAFRSLPPE